MSVQRARRTAPRFHCMGSGWGLEKAKCGETWVRDMEESSVGVVGFLQGSEGEKQTIIILFRHETWWPALLLAHGGPLSGLRSRKDMYLGWSLSEVIGPLYLPLL